MFFNLTVKKAIFILIVIAVIGLISVFFIAQNQDTNIYTTSEVTRGQIVQTVSETGTVKASEEIDLSFLNTGKINKINYKIGDKVNIGAVIAELDYSDLTINRNEAGANLDVARENLNKLRSGATSEEIAIARANVAQAEAVLAAAEKELHKKREAVNENIAQVEKTLYDLESSLNTDVTTFEQAITAAETNLENTVTTYQNTVDNKKDSALVTIDDKLTLGNNALDTIDTTLNDEDGEDLISLKNLDYLADTKVHYLAAEGYLSTANEKLDLAEINRDNENVLSALNEALTALNEVFAALQDCYQSLENSITSSEFTLAELEVLKTNISAEQTVIAAAVLSAETAKQNLDDAIVAYNSSISTAEENLKSAQAAYENAVKTAKNSLATAKVNGEQEITFAESKVDSSREALYVVQAQLNQTLAPANKYDIALNEAKVRQAQAVLDSIVKKIDNSIIKSPISGTVTKINYEAGEQATVGAAVVSLLGVNNFEIEVLISEADITKVEEKDVARITLDAYGEDIVFKGEVTFIEPAETVIQDVIYYKVTVNFAPEEKTVKSGMTANIIITTDLKEDVIIMPGRAVIERNGYGKFARVLKDNLVEERQVEIGLRGDEGLVEVISGVNPGELVVTSINEK